MFSRSPRPRFPRRGVTLVEMLVTVALLILMMTVIVQVFQAATGAVSAARTYQELDGTLRQLDATIRTDLAGVTAKLTPPIDPDNNQGYFEYGENSFADLQGEDCDDYVRFTTKAPEGQLFTGRMYVGPALSAFPNGFTSPAQLASWQSSQPITITSQYAEVIYFLRNGNLYRRVLLVAPEQQNAVNSAFGVSSNGKFQTGTFAGSPFVSWQGVNDISAHPAPSGSNLTQPIVLNTLGDLTNRENRFANMRFSNDFYTTPTVGSAGAAAPPPDGIADDLNQDTIPDFYPTLYASLFNGGSITAYQLINDVQWWPNGNPRSGVNNDLMAFPYLYPGMYSVADPSSSALGSIHTPDPSLNLNKLGDLEKLNHNPLDLGGGDSLTLPGNGSLGGSGLQTWWGGPTWRETMSSNWNDPYRPVDYYSVAQGGAAFGQPNGLSSLSASFIALPPMTGAYLAGTVTPYRLAPQLFTDGAGNTTTSGFALYGFPGLKADIVWKQAWEDDLIATGVRSFDIKAYDNAYPGYVDLGWGDDLRLYVAAGATNVPAAPPLISGVTGLPSSSALGWTFTWPPANSYGNPSLNWSLYNSTLAHEGRMPPLVNDGVADYQYPVANWSGGSGGTTNIGDNGTGVLRARRVWDSWSTDYSNPPTVGVNSQPLLANGNPNPLYGFPNGPPFSAPSYPSYPAPYPAPLRGIQIQIRVVDPRNERIKVLTIRQDFSDKLN